MHSVLKQKQKPRPLIPRINLNAKAYDAALQQIPGAGVENIHAATRGYAVRESIRRRTSEDMPEPLVKAAQGKSAKLGKVAYAGLGRNVAPGRQGAANKKSAARV